MADFDRTTEETTCKQEAFLSALLAAPTIAKAAKQAGISERTAYRYLEDLEFKDEYRRARREQVGHAIVLSQKAAKIAVGTLVQIMGDKNAPPASRVSAARVVLDTAVKAIEIEDLSERLERLEEQVELNGHRR